MKQSLLACLLAGALVLPITGVAATSPATESPSASVQQVELVNINKADPEQLQALLVGVGEVKAKAIVDYRTTHGDFASVDELLEVKGIGNAIVERNRERLSLE